MIVLLILLAILPVAGVLFYVYHKDHDPEPLKTVAFAFLWGCVSVIPAILGEWLLMFDNVFLNATFGIALVEEAVKLAVLMLYIWKHADFNDSFDAIVYSVTVSLGFATVENIMYVSHGDLSVAIARALLAIPGHATFAIVMGYFYAKAKTHYYYGRKDKQYTYLALSLLLPTLIHGIYDYFAMTCSEDNEQTVWLLIFVITIDIICFILLQKASKNDKHIEQDIE
ncbi:MAG: PrsW family intramembrane metalloprotease [Bacteroidales bacterium]|jgi:RsiW-degrading membrane proteinase PrsW (M82 family)|nr:PrsW family intramembrane metalloprotease [Bacteroidales bacterium]